VIYEKPVFKPGGDRYMLIEFGDELNLALNFTAHSLGDAIAQAGMKPVIETAPCFASLLLHYEPDLISFKCVDPDGYTVEVYSDLAGA